MALDIEKTRKNAERLLKQGRAPAALEEYQRLAEECPRDLPLLNIVGDLLTRMGRHAEAAKDYDRIAAEYTRGGFFLRSIAILKKILRASPDRPDVLLQVGDLYLKLKLPGEARGFLLQAADLFVASRSLRQAREVYEKLVEAEPTDPLHRLRLAETLAADGDAAGAGALLLDVGEATKKSGRAAEAERIYRRALELLPGHVEAFEGHARCLAAQGKTDEAVALIERALDARADGRLAVVLLSLAEEAGRGEQALRILTGRFADAMPEDAFDRVVKPFVAQRQGDAVWAALDPLLTRWTRGQAFDRAASVLERLARIEANGHIPALKRLCELRREQADGPGMARTLEALERAYRARSMDEEASAVAERLRELAPGARMELPIPEPGKEPVPPELAGTAPEFEEVTDDPLPDEITAPAVPLGPADLEFVGGRLTQAEIFEKYLLVAQAIEQLREITGRFPGLVEAQQRLAEMLRARGDPPGLRDALVGLAVAQRASGQTDMARQAAEEAARSAPLAEEVRGMLERLSLLAAVRTAAPAPPRESGPAPVVEPPREAAAPPEEPPVTDVETLTDDSEIVIDIEDDPVAAVESEAKPEASAPIPELDSPSEEDLEEIVFYLEQGMVRDARRLIVLQRSRGKGGPALDALETRAAAASAAHVEEAAVVETVEDEPPVLDTGLDDEALLSIAEALGGGVAEAEPPAAAPATFDEQSVEEVFALFKRHVDEEIGSDDYRTHYDLGIAYKEMGLIDDAIGEFQVASGAPGLFRDACSMIAMCCREKGEIHEAVGWYRKALDLPGGDDDALRGLRFDFAEVLEQCGEVEAALELYRRVSKDDPSYRDVDKRIAEIEARGR